MILEKTKRDLIFSWKNLISVFGRFDEDDTPKCIKNYAFSYENGLVWVGENKMKPLVWSKIFCFVFYETKADLVEQLSWPALS